MITTVNNNNSNAFKKKRSFRYSAGSTTYLMTNLSIYLAWFILSATVPNIGYLNLGYTQITYLAALTVIATFHLGFVGNISVGLFFGLSSWFAAYIYGIPKYQYFDLSVIPRVEVALGVYVLFWVFNAFKKPAVWKFALLGVISTMLNHYFVFFAQFLHEKIRPGDLGRHGVPPIEIWLLQRLFNIISEPILGGMLLFGMYPALIALREQYKNVQKLRY
ncbi:hypothetical protein FCM49_01410 [Mycoplasma bovis]|uniref:Uncharacterized protein n=2 Tax=Mycoplasmopsis bovis TaxID=28903 RepID=A0A2N8U3E9_MYCBV|nr:hypothetical protein [Mycoplasmopsis bovis]AEI90460.1 conserved hypothetical protein [Mycoplasmopsis bovis Hubei-1]AFM52130.1 putative transmembrane protein [Mycoplasmopsis bovis HB0801]AKO50913.1 membrane protein [Mycoplasmopsis bovis]AMW25302.1 Hypothetical protein BC85_0691 [Mycoplasmopsis bovis]AMW25933.1 Hypothetical protein BC94_0695 [Mycoplasmopsis bovis]